MVSYNRRMKNREEFQFLTKYKMIHNITFYDVIHIDVEHSENHFKNKFIKQ